MSYDLSAFDPKPDNAIGVDANGDRTFGFLSANGLVEIEVPTPAGSQHPTERMHAKDFGAHVVRKIESAFGPDYLDQKQDPVQNLHHYVGVVKGLQLMDRGTIRRLDELAGKFEKATDKREFFASEVKPFLHNLDPKRR
jgi:hypothetical protein